MEFDRLASDLILELFDYLDAVDIYRAFFNLNTPLNTLLSIYRSYQLDFRRISKTNFTVFCENNLPCIAQRVTSLHLSDEDDTPNLATSLFSNSFTLDRFTHLQSLTLQGIAGSQALIDCLARCDHLVQLNLIQCRFHGKAAVVIDHLWNLPRLLSCTIDQSIRLGQCLSDRPKVSSPIRRLCLKSMVSEWQDLSSLLQWTPRLQQLSIALTCRQKLDHLALPISRLTSLNLSFWGSPSTLASLFQHLPQLRSLKLSTSKITINGHEWKALLDVHLHQLKHFRLKMDFQFGPDEKKEVMVTTLLASFQTTYWMVKKCWFFRCDWSSLSSIQHASLYTLPYAFDEFHFLNRFYSKSTCPNEKDFWVYEHVRSLAHIDNLSSTPAYFPWRFLDLVHLEMVLPCCDSFLTVIPSLTKLSSLDLTILPGEKAYAQLQILLDRAIRLRQLKFSHLSDLSLTLFQLTNPSVRRLDFFTKESMLYSWYFNREQCIAFAHSSLGQQCETLVVDLKHRNNILELIDRMPNLRSLIFQCRDDVYTRQSSSTHADELLQWLTERLPSTCSISREEDQTSIAQIWIR